MNTVIGTVCDEHTLASDPAQHRRAWASPASAYRSLQDPVPVDLEHDGQAVGEVVHLERHRGNLLAVAEVDAMPAVAVRVADETVYVPTDLYFSAQRIGPDDDLLLTGLALTHRPARAAAAPVLWFEGPLARRSSWLHNRRRITGHLADLITRASDARHDHGRTGLRIYDTDPPAAYTHLERSSGYPGGYLDQHGEYIPPATRGGPVALDDQGRAHTLLVRPSRILGVY